MEIHLLDVGDTRYGDCILITHGHRRILIDGAHPGDTQLIRKQLAGLLTGGEPYAIDLLIVTHCHIDHIGTLPALLDLKVLDVKAALVADEKLGFGRDSKGNRSADALPLSDNQKMLLTALQEEDYSDLDNRHLSDFLFDARSLEDNYKGMLEKLSSGRLIRYGTDPLSEVRNLENDFSDFGLKILGPTSDQLLFCAEVISRSASSAADDMQRLGQDATISNLEDQYRALAKPVFSDAVAGGDQPGAAKNDQSIIIKLEAGGWTALLAGDMQFHAPGVSAIKPLMVDLLKVVSNAGPYDFIKLTHHSSDNGLDDTVLKNWLRHTKLFAHSGGTRDKSHPNKKVLALLESHSSELEYARTDRNGLITVKKGAKVAFEVTEGEINDFTANTGTDASTETLIPTQSSARQSVNKSPLVQAPIVQPVENIPDDDQFVEVHVKIPHRSTRVLFTIDIDPEKKKPDNGIAKPKGLPVDQGNGRFDRILFITSQDQLAKNIGETEAKEILHTLEGLAGSKTLQLPSNITSAVEAMALLRADIIQHRPRGIVLIGGYDVVPADRVDTIDAQTRRQIENLNLREEDQDRDDFIVWNDDLYGDLDGDLLPELPVSRIPDGKEAELLRQALLAPTLTMSGCFGVRNSARPFADLVYPLIPGDRRGPLAISETFKSADTVASDLPGAVYCMLHGSATDGTRFWGELKSGHPLEAVNINNLPHQVPGSLIFSGCCWGALSVDPQASQVSNALNISPRTADQSIALAYLKRGAIAVVGCTGSHYSPNIAPFQFFGKPMHDHFWQNIGAGMLPSQALFEAKKAYAGEIPHGQTYIFNKAIEMKILRQFTCLGLGW